VETTIQSESERDHAHKIGTLNFHAFDISRHVKPVKPKYCCRSTVGLVGVRSDGSFAGRARLDLYRYSPYLAASESKSNRRAHPNLAPPLPAMSTLNQPAVLDLGSGLTKAGFAGTPTPHVVLGSLVGRPKLPRVMPSSADPSLPLVGSAALGPLAGVVRTSYPLTRGTVADKGDAQALWAHVLDNELALTHGEHPVLVTENPLNPRANRALIAELFFEAFQVPALYVAVPAVLALYATGRTTGVVLDVGDQVMTAVPVAEGHVASHSVSRVDLGGRDVSARLAALLRKTGASLLASSSERDAVRRIKERACYVARSPADDELRAASGDLEDLPYELPDGNVVHVGPERFRAAELLFDPSLAGTEYAGAHECVHTAVQGVDVALRKQMYASVVLAGGGTKTRGFAQRLVDELRPLPPPNTKIRVHAPPDRLVSAFTGGSILASLSTFRTAAVSSQDYFEHGDSIVQRMM
jgi:centractin